MLLVLFIIIAIISNGSIFGRRSISRLTLPPMSYLRQNYSRGRPVFQRFMDPAGFSKNVLLFIIAGVQYAIYDRDGFSDANVNVYHRDDNNRRCCFNCGIHWYEKHGQTLIIIIILLYLEVNNNNNNYVKYLRPGCCDKNTTRYNNSYILVWLIIIYNIILLAGRC